MAKTISALELALTDRRPGETRTAWLYGALRSAILDGHLRPGTRLPASRDFARLHGVSRGTVVSVFERLRSEGYIASRVGAGTWVDRHVKPKAADRSRAVSGTPPAYIRRVVAAYARPKALVGLTAQGPRPFQMHDPDVSAFPHALWARVAARRVRRFASWAASDDDGRGYRPLREAVAHYLAASRGVRCGADQVVIVSGAQQALDLLARLLVRQGEPVWVEDPGYFGATIALDNLGATVIPVPVDDQGLSVTAGAELCDHPRGIYLTPAHQFPLGMTMSLERRMDVLRFAARVGAFIIEDDYDSEYRFEGRPVPTLQSLDRTSSVILVGSFSKLLFPTARLGYVVLPPTLADYFVAFRRRTDLRSVNLDQAVLCDFIVDGHLGRHLRRMRDLYAGRLAVLLESGREHLDGLLEISSIQAGLYTIGFLQNGMTSQEAEAAAAARNVEALALDRFTLARPDPRGVVLGFGAFDERVIRAGVVRLAEALATGDAAPRAAG